MQASQSQHTTRRQFLARTGAAASAATLGGLKLLRAGEEQPRTARGQQAPEESAAPPAPGSRPAAEPRLNGATAAGDAREQLRQGGG